MEGTRPIRLPVAEMTSDEALAAVAFAERELQLMQANAVPALALLDRAAAGDQSAPQRELCRAGDVETLVRTQQQTARLRAELRALQQSAAASLRDQHDLPPLGG